MRDRLRFATMIGLVYATTSQQIRAILAELAAILRRHPKIWPADVRVRFQELAASSLDIAALRADPFVTRDRVYRWIGSNGNNRSRNPTIPSASRSLATRR